MSYGSMLIHCDNCNKHTNNYFQCEECNRYFCYYCDIESYPDETYCTVDECNNCYRCIYNDNDEYVTHGYYCADCVPDEVSDNVERRRKYLERLELDKLTREKKLIRELHDHGLVLRDDSTLCHKYIEFGDENINSVIKRMCKMRFLFEKCHMRQILNQIKSKYRDDYYDYDNVFREAEKKALKKHANGKYPNSWPWNMPKLHRYADIIKKYCHNWLWKPVTIDGKLGINARIALRKSGLGDYLYASDIDGL